MFSSYKPPEIRILKGAKIQAFVAPIVAGPPDGFRGGIVLGDSVGERKLRHSRYGEAVDSFSVGIDNYEFLKGKFIYFGPFYNHFGHTMSEFVHRIIPSVLLSSWNKFIFIASAEESIPEYPRFFRSILTFLGISLDNVCILNKNSRVEELFVCEQGSDFGAGPKDGYLAYLDDFTFRRLDEIVGPSAPFLKTYVSRTRVIYGGSLLGETYVESFLEDAGYHIMHPQDICLLEQMQTYRSSRILIFPEGSACHGVEFFGNNSLEECHVLERRPDHREIYARIFRGRSKKFSCLTGSIRIGSAVVHPITGIPIENMDVSYIPSSIFLKYLRESELSDVKQFSVAKYAEAAIAEFERYLSYHRRFQSRMLPDAELHAMRLRLEDVLFD